MHDQEVKLNTHFGWIDLHEQRLYWTVWTWIPLISTVLTISNVTSFSPGDYCEVNLCHNGGTCVTGVGDDPFICICADGFGGDTCNLTETGTWQEDAFFFLTCFFSIIHAVYLLLPCCCFLRALQPKPLQERRIVWGGDTDPTRGCFQRVHLQVPARLRGGALPDQ